MTRHDDTTRLHHMLDYAREAVEMTAGRQRTNLDQDRMFQLALVRLVEVVGEAATRVSAEGQRRYDTIPWAEVRGLRNRLVHGYDIVDLNILWDIVQDDLPPLIAELERILEAL
jgi:uncharacterized protein with HEPN domain